MSELILYADHDTVTFPSEAVVITPGLSSISSLDIGVNGVMPSTVFLSSRDRGVEKSGIVLTSGMQPRVLRKCNKLAKPKGLW